MLKLSLIQRNKNIGSKVWYIREYNTETAEIRYISTGEKTKANALDILEEHRKKQFLTPAERIAEKLPTIKSALLRWLDSVSANNSNNTYISYKNQVRRLKKIEHLKLNEFTTSVANNLILELPQDMQINSKIKAIRVYSTFLQWAFNTYDIEKTNPFKKVKTPKREKKEVYFWTIEEIEKLLDNAPTPSKRFFWAIMAFSGLRFFEALELTHEQIDIDNKKLKVKGKGNKLVVIPISNRFIEEYQKFLKTSNTSKGRLFEDSYNGTENNLLKATAKKINLNSNGVISCHRFRHSFASNLLRNGASIIAVSKLMRHENPSLTLNIYSHCLPDDLGQTLELLTK